MMDLWTGFALGLVGSLHCAGMCGPLALALPGGGAGAAGYLGGRMAYNAGRTVTYCGMGLVFGGVGQTLGMAGVQRWVSIGLGLLLLAGLVGSRRLSLWQPATRLVGRLKSAMAGLLRQRSVVSLGVLGLLNGLLPCGLVYVALAGATATGSMLAGVQYMALFGLGTTPLMLAISLSGKLVPLTWRLKLRKAIPVSVFLIATLLILRGMSLGIPYLSPNLASGGACCHP
ncbi:MAG TPA: sulfite exporter TauE/SafE family protein [Candidatus Paceibacterota bacterium]|nr:sulfite exporter TauE/SafE family protein [Candidatus Paceibacterota bacterium]